MDKRTLSFSGLKDYETCELKYYYGKVKRLSGKGTSAMSLGKAYHEALERYVSYLDSNKVKSNASAGIKIIKSVISEYGLVGQDAEEFQESFLNYIASYEEDLESLVAVEFKLGINEKGVAEPFDFAVIRGIVDKIYIKDDLLVIVDYKTGKSMQYDEKQFYLYAFLLFALRDKLDGKWIKFNKVVGIVDFPRFDYSREIPITFEEANNFGKYVYRTWQEIRDKAEDEFVPVVGEHCLSCPFASICKAVKDKIDEELLEASPEALVEEYFRLQVEQEKIKTRLKALAEDKDIIVGDYQVGYSLTNRYVWDVEAVLEDLRERNMLNLLSLSSTKALKYDWIKDKALKDVKKSATFRVKKIAKNKKK